MGEIPRRDFMGLVGASVASLLFSRLNTSSATGLFSGGASEKGFDSLDELTKKMLDELGTVERKDIKYFSRPNYYDDASVFICANTQNYHIDYFVWTNNGEQLTVNGKENWRFDAEKTLKGATELTTFGYTNGSKKFDPKSAVHVFTRIRDLLNIDVHSQNCKGKDLTSLVDDLSVSVLSIEKFRVEYNNDLNIEASFKNRNFKIEYKFDEKDKKVEFTVRDEKNELSFFGIYNKDGDINTINLDINSSNFHLFGGELERFPRRVYNEASAIGIITKAKAIEMYLTSTIKNTKLENYTALFERLTSVDINNQRVIEKGDGGIRIRVGELAIQYCSGSYDHVHINSGSDRVYICADRETKEVRGVIINNHPFLVKDGRIHFIRSTYGSYREEQATFVVQRAQQFYNNKIRPIGDTAF